VGGGMIGHRALADRAQGQVERTAEEVRKENQPKADQNGPRPQAEKLRLRVSLPGHASSVAFSPDGKTLAWGDAIAGEGARVHLWDMSTGKERGALAPVRGVGISSVAFSPDGKTLAIGGRLKAVKLWDVATGNERDLLGHQKMAGTFAEHVDAGYLVYSVAFSRDGKTLASGSIDGTVKLWETATGKERATLKAHQLPVPVGVFVLLSPDGNTVVWASDWDTVKLWDVASGKVRATLNGWPPLAISPDGTVLASAGHKDAKKENGKFNVKLWEMATGKELATYEVPTEMIMAVAFSPDGKTLASYSRDVFRTGDHTVKLWDVATGKVRAGAREEGTFACLAFSPDGKTLATGTEKEPLKLWDVPAVTQEDGKKRPARQPTDQKAEPDRSANLSANDLGGLWATLAGGDAPRAFQAVNTLVGAPRHAVTLLKEQLRPAPEVTAEQTKHVERLIADLDSAQFSVRQKARQELEKLGEPAVPGLHQALAKKPSLEVRMQIDQLLDKAARDDSTERLRALRAIEVLERIGSPEAKQVLASLAKGAEGFRLTEEAKASVERLNKRVAADK
jgi:WD40 repeat protein